MAAPTVWGGSRNAAVTLAQFSLHATVISMGATESQKAWPVRVAGTFSKFVANFDANGTGRTLALRKNAGNSACVISPPDSTAGQFQSTGVDHYAVGNTVDIEPIGVAPAFTAATHLGLFTADVGVANMVASRPTNAAAVLFCAPGASLTATETFVKFLVRAPGAFQNMIASVTANSAAGTNVITSRKNGAAGAMTLSIGATLTGIFEDTTNSDTLASGDTFGFSNSTSSATLTNLAIGCTVVHSTIASEIVGSNPSWAFSASPQFTSLPGSFTVATESTGQLPLGLDGKLSNLRFSVGSNSMTGTFVYALRKNGVTANQTVSVSAGATGTFEDATHTDLVLAADQTAYIATGGTAGTIAFAWTAITLTPSFATGVRRPTSYHLRK